MHSKYNGYSFPLRDTVKREKVQLESWLPWPCLGPLGL